jgi:hypothetical protein
LFFAQVSHRSPGRLPVISHQLSVGKHRLPITDHRSPITLVAANGCTVFISGGGVFSRVRDHDDLDFAVFCSDWGHG